MSAKDSGLVASAGSLFSTLIDPVARQTPAANESRGDERLQEARKLAFEYESVIDVNGRAAIEDRITYAREIKLGLGSKWGLDKVMQARGYRRAATNALSFIKTLTDGAQIPWRGDDEFHLATDRPGHSPSRLGIADTPTNRTLTRVINVARPLYRSYLSCRDAFPTANKKAEWAEIVWCEASIRTGSYLGPSLKAEWFTVNSMYFLADVRMKVRRAVEASYDFHASPKSKRDNAARARQLLSDSAFIYREHNSNENLEYPYRHPIIQEAINILWFKNKDDDGMTFQEHFSPMPIRAMALVLAVIQCCIDEWTDGTRTDSNWDEKCFKTVYQWHIDALTKFHDHDNAENADPLEVIRSDLLHNASGHAERTDTLKAQPEDALPSPVIKIRFEGEV